MSKRMEEPDGKQLIEEELLPGTEILTKTPWHHDGAEENTKLELIEHKGGPDQISYVIHEKTGQVVGPFMVTKTDFLQRLGTKGIRHTYLDVEKLPDSERNRLMVEASKRFATGQPLRENSTLAHVLDKLSKS